MDWQAFFAMGGYAVYVWPSYGLAAVLLIANALIPHWRERRLLQQLQASAREET
ncbi:MAG: heme exporter protein CcmD [Halofilum sp. (in: g-proteobacteria)]